MSLKFQREPSNKFTNTVILVFSDIRFATEQLSVALWQSGTQFLSGTTIDKLKNLKDQKTQTQLV